MQSQGLQPCIITAAITGSVPRKENNPAVPITVSEQIESTHAAFEAGAALVHVHVRNDDGSTTSNPDKFAEFQERIRKICPGHHRAVLDRWTFGCRIRARRHAASPAGHGVTLNRLVQLPYARLRELTRADPGARRKDAPIRREAGDRSLRSRDALQRRELRARRLDQGAAPRAVRARREARAAGGTRHPRVRGQEARGADARGDVGRRRHRPSSARGQSLVPRDGRSLPHGTRRQRPLGQASSC